MLTKYIDEAMKLARYEQIEDGTYVGEIPGFDGVWGNEATIEGCRSDLRGSLEGWLILKLWDHDDDIPVLGRLSVYPKGLKEASKRGAAVTQRTRKAS